MFTQLTGYRTYVCVVLGCLVVLAMGLGYIEVGTGNMILTFLGFGTAAALRSAIDQKVKGE